MEGRSGHGNEIVTRYIAFLGNGNPPSSSVSIWLRIKTKPKAAGKPIREALATTLPEDVC